VKRSDKANCYGFEGYDPCENKPQLVSSQSESIELSQRIIEVLASKAEAHNDEFEKKVDSSQLKEVFRNAADQADASENWTRCQFAMARVGMFLDMVSSGKVKEVCKNSELEIVHGKEIDYFDYIVIDAKHIEAAKKELDEIGIGNLDFNNAKEDLFLETDETPLTLDFEV
jgi:hypothetical protein